MLRMRGYKRVKIEEDNSNNNNNSFLENKSVLLDFLFDKNFLKYFIIIVGLVIFFSFLSFYLIYQKSSNNNEIIEEKDITEIKSTNDKILNLKEKSEMLTKKIQKYEKTLRKITTEEIDDFRKINTLGILNDLTKYKRTETPDISIVTTMRNQAHCIHKAIRSVQNQSLKNIEMIIVDDCSLDNSTEVVEQFMKEDDRIILVKHNINEGIMITRNEAIHMAKGKYISVLDADDTFIHKDILNYSLHVANMADLDIVEFYSSLYSKHKFQGYFHFHRNHSVIFQPELKTKFYEFNDEAKFRPIKCRTVWGKIVKNEIFQKTLENIPDKYLYDYILGFEDTMITVSLYQVAQSYYLLNQPGYYYSLDEKKNRFPHLPNKKCKEKEGVVKGIDHIKFLQFLVDKLDDNKFGKQVLFHEIKAINNYDYSNFKKTITHHFDWAYNIFDLLLNSEDITEKQKEYLQKIKDEIKENENNQKL